MDLQSNDFELFNTPERFGQDESGLASRWKELQRLAHPDRHAGEGGAAQRVAMQWSVRINEAYSRLRDPLKRAAYLCELRGSPIGAETNTAMPAAFLMQQMQWREDLDEADQVPDIERLETALDFATRETLDQIMTDLDLERDQEKGAQAAAAGVRALMFLRRFARDVAERRDQLGQ